MSRTHVLIASSSLVLEVQDPEAKLRAKEAAFLCVQALRARLGPRAQPPLSFPGAAYNVTSCFTEKSTNVQRDKPSTQNLQLIGCLRPVGVTAIIRDPHLASRKELMGGVGQPAVKAK